MTIHTPIEARSGRVPAWAAIVTVFLLLVGGVYLASNLAGENPALAVPGPSGSGSPGASGGVDSGAALAIIKTAGCQACHGQINAAGFAFENYDAVGGYRTDEEGQKVDASGTLNLASAPITFKNAVELMKTGAKSPELRQCVARSWIRALLRREERPEEAGSLKDIGTAFAAANYDMRSLIVAVTKTRAFTHRNPIGK